jgi:hypothetical protein
MGFNRRKLEDQRREESEVQSKVRSRRSTPKMASAAMASRSARGIFLYPRTFVIRNVDWSERLNDPVRHRS